MSATSNYPDGDAGPDSESGPVDDEAVDGADDAAAETTANLDGDGSLGPGSTATGGAIAPHEDGARGPGGVHATQVDHNPDSLVEHGRVATAKDME